MAANPKELVVRGYDAVAGAYLGRFSSSAVRDTWLAAFVAFLPEEARVLDLGCGAGIPVAKRLVELGHDVTGVDGSARQIQLARAHVPAAAFLRADMMSVELPAAAFDGVAAFYSITHVPAPEQGPLLARIGVWLKPGGIFVGSFGAGEAHDWTGEWLGTEMFFSHNDETTSVALVHQAGFRLLRVEPMRQDNEDASFLWILARKNASVTRKPLRDQGQATILSSPHSGASLSSTMPASTSAIPPNRNAISASPNSATPASTVPAAPMPVHTA